MGFIAALGVGISLCTTSSTPPIRYERFAVGRAVYHVVKADLVSGSVSLETVHSPQLTSFWNLISVGQPVAALTGTFFSPKSQKPVADVIVDGSQVSYGSIGSALGISWYGRVDIFDRPFHTPVDWSTYRFGLRGGVRVVENGVVKPNPKAQRFRDRRIWGRAARAGIGLTGEGRLLLVATKSKVTLSEFGKALKSRGVIDGISLDGGGSTCLYYQGSLVVPPMRKLSNLVVLKNHPAGKIGAPANGADAAFPSLRAVEKTQPVAAKPLTHKGPP